MKKMVTIARALKEKNRVAGRLAKARQLVATENSNEKKIPRRVDVAAVREEARTLAERLVAIKSAIAAANAPVVGTIIELDETKSAIAWLNGLNVREGVFEETNYGGKVVKEYEAVIDQAAVLIPGIGSVLILLRKFMDQDAALHAVFLHLLNLG